MKFLKRRTVAKTSAVAGKLFQTLTIRLEKKCFLTSTRLWCTNNLLACPRVVLLGVAVNGVSNGGISSHSQDD